MNRSYRFLLSLSIALFAGLPFTGCSDTLLPPDDSGSNQNNNQNNNNNQDDPNKITLKGNLVLESPLAADAKVVLVWTVSSGSSDYSIIYGEGTINRANNTFEIAVDGPPPVNALNWLNRAAYDTGFGTAIVAVVPSKMPVGVPIYNSDEPVYGVVNSANLIYFSTESDWLWQSNPDGCYDWTKQFNQGYKFGAGLPAPEGCMFDGFTPMDSNGLYLIVNSNPDRFEFVNWI